MNRTDIQWTWNDALEPKSGWTWNPLVGCRRVSKGCGSCYAERLIATRLSRHRVYKGLAVMKASGPQFTGDHKLIVDRLDEPLRKRNPKSGRTFVCDLGDMFFEGHTFEEIAAVFGVMLLAHWHTFQILTKRAKWMAAWFAWIDGEARRAMSAGAPSMAEAMQSLLIMYAVGAGLDQRAAQKTPLSAVQWPLPNVWLGTSTEDQSAADERIAWLLRCPAPVHFLSIEPQCGPVDLRLWLGSRFVNWVIDGGESGPGARPFDLRWTRSTQAQCRAAGVAYFRKQLGATPINGLVMRLQLEDSHGGDESEWPADLRGARAFPSVAR